MALKGWQVSPSFITLFGVPLIGPGMQPRAAKTGQAWSGTNTVILTQRFWRQRFNSDPAIIGAKLILNGEPREIAGVLPKTLGFIEEMTDAIVPLPDDALREGRVSHYLNVFARLRPGVSLGQARAEMQTIARQLEKEYRKSDTGFGIKVNSLRDDLVSGVRTAFFVLHGVVGFVLLIACVNVANLLLARSASRGKEIAIRVALGAGRLRIMRQLLTESILLALLGGGLGIPFACWGVELLKALAPKLGEGSIPMLDEISIDGHVLAFTAGISLLSGLVFGMIPAWQASKPNLQQALKESERGQSAGKRRYHLLNCLTTAEVALSLVLLVGAGLMSAATAARSAATRVLIPAISSASKRIALQQIRGRRAADLILRTRARARFLSPRRRLCRAGQPAPLAPHQLQSPLLPSKATRRPAREHGPLPSSGSSTPDTSELCACRSRKGRYFDKHDDGRGAPVMIINETLAHRYFPRRIPLASASASAAQVVRSLVLWATSGSAA